MTPVITIGLLALCFAQGCIYIPAKSSEYRSSAVGSDANAQFSVGRSTRADIVARFGQPKYKTEDDSAYGYVSRVNSGYWAGVVWGPCMPTLGTSEQWVEDDVWLEFSQAGVLRNYDKRLIQKYGTSDNAWQHFLAQHHSNQ